MLQHHPTYRPAEINQPNLITVTGEGSISVQPNIAEITLGVIEENQSLSQAQESNATAIANILAALRQTGITDAQMQTVHYAIDPQYDYHEGQQIFRNYRVEHMLQITVQQLENTGAIVDNAVHNGANVILSIHFDTADQQHYYQQALALAITNANQKAETIANTLRVPFMQPPISVVENPEHQAGPPPLSAAAFAKNEAVTSVLPSAIVIKSRITAEYIY